MCYKIKFWKIYRVDRKPCKEFLFIYLFYFWYWISKAHK